MLYINIFSTYRYKIMRQLVKKIIKRLIPNRIKYIAFRLISRSINPSLEAIYMKLASLDKVQHNVRMLEKQMEQQIQRLASIEKFEIKLKSFNIDNLDKIKPVILKESENSVIKNNVFSDTEYNNLEKNICRGRKLVENDYFDSLAENFTKEANILDLGCGDGAFIKRMNAKGFFATGVDSNTECAKELNVILGSVPEALRHLKSDSYDIVTSFHLIEHMNLNNYKEMVIEINKKKKKMGRYFLKHPILNHLLR